MPKQALTYEQRDEILFIEWLLEKLREHGNPNIDIVRSNMGLTTEAGKLKIVKHISSNKNVYQNYIGDNLDNDDTVYRSNYW